MEDHATLLVVERGQNVEAQSHCHQVERGFRCWKGKDAAVPRLDCAASAVAPNNMSRCCLTTQASGDATDWLAFACSVHVALQQ